MGMRRGVGSRTRGALWLRLWDGGGGELRGWLEGRIVVGHVGATAAELDKVVGQGQKGKRPNKAKQRARAS